MAPLPSSNLDDLSSLQFYYMACYHAISASILEITCIIPDQIDCDASSKPGKFHATILTSFIILEISSQ